MCLFTNVTVTILFVGLQLFMSLHSLFTFLSSPPSVRKGKVPYIATSLLIVFFALTASLDAYTNARTMFETKSGSQFIELTGQIEWEWSRILSLVSLFMALFIGDGLLLYRAFIVWKDQCFVLIVPGLCYLASMGLGFYIASPLKTDAWNEQSRAIASAFTFLAVSVNTMVTILICTRLLRARRSIAHALPDQHLRVYTKIVIVLIESALPVTVFGIGYAISLVIPMGKTTQLATVWQVMSLIFALLYFGFATLSPQLIIFRVTSGRSWTNSTEMTGGPHVGGHGSKTLTSQPIRFASMATSKDAENSIFSLRGEVESGVDHGMTGTKRDAQEL
ncbi:hypothetical protein CC1G_10474 [Coprinopsis cinerea okayama7|uniref:Pheromone receptor n=1 Tax=Coprinopsis cinerea (strain Okayama-7 / 130 / ATCC MYA-4618 / FGSC 9003) TaxID=240176 RepID=A8NL32_COPC7|nr:hypothetical protein CC1G_10474 [Coprinopsis cinerea okayama7\|eukprot:XP_001834600.1 hypothetical protein CC1G_10474 [Coprinopsis cinerea okayama7\